MASHGTLSDFDSDREDWTSYTERLEQYFEANDVVSAVKQRAILLSICGVSTYLLIRDLVAPTKPISKSFAELVKLVKDPIINLHPLSLYRDLISTCDLKRKGKLCLHL